MPMTRKTMFAAILASAPLALPVSAAEIGDAELGAEVYKKECSKCHQVGDGAKNRVGPTLNGIVGAAAAANPDFKYSKAMQAAGEDGLVWTEEELDAYLTKPRDYMKGTKMSFGGFRDEGDIAAVTAYLSTFDE